MKLKLAANEHCAIRAGSSTKSSGPPCPAKRCSGYCLKQRVNVTSAARPQASHVAVTGWTPFARIFASVIGGPNLPRMAMRRARGSPRTARVQP
jgi:hypothetical protein